MPLTRNCLSTSHHRAHSSTASHTVSLVELLFQNCRHKSILYDVGRGVRELVDLDNGDPWLAALLLEPSTALGWLQKHQP